MLKRVVLAGPLRLRMTMTAVATAAMAAGASTALIRAAFAPMLTRFGTTATPTLPAPPTAATLAAWTMTLAVTVGTIALGGMMRTGRRRRGGFRRRSLGGTRRGDLVAQLRKEFL
jgi:hypothetical protein